SKRDGTNEFWKKVLADTHTFALDPGPPPVLYARASSAGTLAKSFDRGDTWQTLENVNAVYVLWYFHNNLYAYFYDGRGGERSLKKSSDGGKTWADLHLTLPRNWSVTDLCV